MAEKKITDLPESSHILESDFVEFVDTNSNTSKKITLENVAKSISHGDLGGLTTANDHPQYALTAHDHDSAYLGINAKAADSDKLDGNDSAYFMPISYKDGWIPVSDTWTYVSATSFKITGKNVAYRFPKGTKIKLVQSGTTKYFYVTAATFSTDTTVTVTGGSDYSLADATISGQAYSYAATPQGFPQWFNYTPIWSATGGTPDLGNGTIVGKFSIIGTNIHYLGKLQFGSTTSAGTTTNWKFSIPIIITDVYNYLGQAFIYDVSGGGATYMRTVSIDKYQDANNLYLFLPMNDGSPKLYISYNDPFTFGTSDLIAWDIWYVV